MLRAPLALGVIAALGLSPVLPASAANRREKPPACSAVSFHPFAGPLTASPVTAGHYSSRFGTIDVLGAEENGQPNYRVQMDRQALAPLEGDIPKSAYACLRSKHVKTPPEKIAGSCNGGRFRVVIDSSTGRKLVMLYALQGDDWKLCEAGHPAAAK
ncbi:MAG: hypothetical protein M0006_10960 [Magnetospirillum sp.]|nr:hypothetical protein [Magnetospirillum sp.]